MKPWEAIISSDIPRELISDVDQPGASPSKHVTVPVRYNKKIMFLFISAISQILTRKSEYSELRFVIIVNLFLFET